MAGIVSGGSPAVLAQTTGNGSAVSASVNNSASIADAVSATTNGTRSAIHGRSANATGTGVSGQGSSGATGVAGFSDSGPGVAAQSTTGVALQVTGKVTFSSSGTATVAAGQISVTVSQSSVSPSSLVLATPQQVQPNVALAGAVPGTGSFTITLTHKAATPLPVAWFVIG